MKKFLAVAGSSVLGGILALAASILFHRPAPPPPGPEPAPKAALSGMFWQAGTPGVQATPGAPLGMFVLDASASVSRKPIRWKVDGPPITPIVLDPASGVKGSIAQAYPTLPGTYRFHAIARGMSGGEPDADAASVAFTVGAPAPTPVPPGPAPSPTPAPPKPPAPPEPPAPIPADGLRVLFIYESADLSKYAKDQLAVFYDQGFRDYLAGACAKVNNTPEYRIYDKDTDMSNESKVWQDAMKRPHPELPWMVVSNGKAGYEGKVPANLAEAKALVQKYEVKP